MADAVKDAKLRLDLDTTKAVRGMEEVVRAGEKVERQLEKTEQAAEKATGAIGSGAAAAARTFERFGEGELSKSEIRGRRRAEKAWERKHDAAQASLDEYRLKSHYGRLRQERADAEQRQAEAEQRRADADAARQSRMEAMSAARDERFASHIAGRMGAGDGTSLFSRAGSMAGALRGGIAGLAGTLGVAAAGRVGNSIADTMDLYNNRDLTATQKWQRDSESIPGIGNLIRASRRLQEAFDGTTEFMRRIQYRLQEMEVRVAGEARVRQELTERGSRVEEAGHRVAFPIRLGAGPLQNFDRFTIAGQIAHEEQMRRVGAADAFAGAQAEAQASQAEVRSARRRFGEADFEYQDRARRRERASQTAARMRNGGTKREYQTALENEAAALAEERNAFEQRERLRDDLGRAGVNAARAEQQARERGIDQLRVEIGLLQQREQRLTSAAGRLGAMNPIQRRLGVEAVRAIQQRGFGNVTPEMRDNAAAVAPEWFQQQSVRFGEGTAEFRQLQQLGAIEQTPAGGIAGIQREQVLMNQLLRQQIVANQNAANQDIANVMQEAFRGLADVIRETVEQAVRELRNRIAIQNHAQN